MNLVLVGMMGSGKSTVGKMLADNINYQFLDTDNLIVKNQGCKISEIFYYAGEVFFRELETKILLDCTGMKNLILATGGGILVKPGNLNIIRNIGKVVYLKAEAKILFKRVASSKHRPLASFLSLDEFKQLYFQRDKEYHKADFVLDTHRLTKKEVCAKILFWLKNENSR